MKKIGILTLNGYFNFGNRLQNYALVKTLSDYGFFVNTIWFCSFKTFIREKIRRFFCLNKRKKKFVLFSDRFLNTKFFINKNINNKYDYFVVGSDQVWNYNYVSFGLDYFLSFSDYEKNISYAASIGVDNIPLQFRDVFVRGLNNIKYISVREQNAKNIVKALINKECKVLIDPTFLLEKDDWIKIEKKPTDYSGKKYILCYFLGTISRQRKEEIERVAKELDCEIINILDEKSKLYNSGPSEFLWLERNAELICTDSFHSSVFALLFDRPFIVFEREDKEETMNSRIETLIDVFELKGRMFNGKTITRENLYHDYSISYKILEEEKRKSRLFLENALNINMN